MIKLDLSSCSGFKHHRSGWNFCINQLRGLHSRSGIFVDDFIERSFSWDVDSYYEGRNKYNLPYQKDWIGFMHNPPNVPNWFDFFNSPQAILDREVFQQSLRSCRCLITLSDYLKEWLQERIEVPVISLKHATEIPEITWNPKYFISQQRIPIVQLGYWLRKMHSINKLKCTPRYHKMWLPSNYEYAHTMLTTFYKTQKRYRDFCFEWGGVQIENHIENYAFDILMAKSIVFLDLYDSSANNAVIECIARNTPILVNRIDAVVEYLGEEYPLYFDDLRHAYQITNDMDKIFEAHDYLKNMDKEWISGRSFASSLHSKIEQVL